MRHDRVGAQLHCLIYKALDTETTAGGYEIKKLHCLICKALGTETTAGGYEIKKYTDREVMANRPDIIMKNRKEKTCLLIDVAIPADRNVLQKEADKELKQQLMYRDTANVEHEMCDYTGSNWSQRNSNKRYKEKSASHSSKTLNRLTTKDSLLVNKTR
jgi:hypothetical protein